MQRRIFLVRKLNVFPSSFPVMVRSCAKDNAGSPSSSICVRKAGRQKETWCLSAVLPQLCVSALRRSALFPLSLSR